MMPKTFCDNVSVTQRGAAEQLPLETPHETSLPNWDDNNDNGRIFSRKCSNYHLWQWIEIDQQVDPGKCPNINIEPTVQKTFRDQSTGWLIYAEGKAIVGELKVTKLKYLIICHFSPWREALLFHLIARRLFRKLWWCREQSLPRSVGKTHVS